MPTTIIYKGLYGHVKHTYPDGSIKAYIPDPRGIGWELYLTPNEFQYKECCHVGN